MEYRGIALKCVAMTVLLAAAMFTQAQDPSLSRHMPKPRPAKPFTAMVQQHPSVRSEADTCAYTFTDAGSGNCRNYH